MRVGVLGTGVVGRTIGARLVEVGHEVVLGSRTADNADAVAWAGENGDRAGHGTFADAGAFGEVLFNCTGGVVTLAACEACGEQNIGDKILVDVSNPLDFSGGMPPRLAVANTDSVGEQLQRRFPAARVVKSLNTMNSAVMVHPASVPGYHNVFVSGDDAAAKTTVTELLGQFGWPKEAVIDLGDIKSARGAEALVLFWVFLRGALGGNQFNLGVVPPPALS
ncbi:MAG: NAD(P)-binding domain-containing protein [Acidimicrobiales bacterium]|nr:NAD(P)-binding domain-containing protein [Acidimicrobiales bacterium]